MGRRNQERQERRDPMEVAASILARSNDGRVQLAKLALIAKLMGTMTGNKRGADEAASVFGRAIADGINREKKKG